MTLSTMSKIEIITRVVVNYECRYCGYRKRVNFGLIPSSQTYHFLEGSPPEEVCPNEDCKINEAVDRFRGVVVGKLYNPWDQRGLFPLDWEHHLRGLDPGVTSEPEDAWWIYLQVVGDCLEDETLADLWDEWFTTTEDDHDPA